jgi:hypothetical protein
VTEDQVKEAAARPPHCEDVAILDVFAIPVAEEIYERETGGDRHA